MSKRLFTIIISTLCLGFASHLLLAIPQDATELPVPIVRDIDIKGPVREHVSKAGKYYYDESTETCYRIVHTNDFIVYYAVTNINITLPENIDALEWMEVNWYSVLNPPEPTPEEPPQEETPQEP